MLTLTCANSCYYASVARELKSYPLTPPSVRPLIIYLCTKRVKIKIGIVAITQTAEICPNLHDSVLLKAAISSGKVLAASRVSTRANRNSFHAKMKQRMAVAIIPGAARGMIILNKAPNLVDPSIIADSSISVGISWKKLLNIQTAKGRFIAV